MTVVGVVQNEVQGADLGAPYEPMVYLDHLALPETSFLSAVFSMSGQYAVRSALPETAVASELRAVVKQDAPTMVEMSLNPMEEQISQSLGQRRLALRLVAGFGIVALILSAVGIYGVLGDFATARDRNSHGAWIVARESSWTGCFSGGKDGLGGARIRDHGCMGRWTCGAIFPFRSEGTGRCDPVCNRRPVAVGLGGCRVRPCYACGAGRSAGDFASRVNRSESAIISEMFLTAVFA